MSAPALTPVQAELEMIQRQLLALEYLDTENHRKRLELQARRNALTYQMEEN